MDEAINAGSTARFPLIPPETQAAMRQDRMDGMTLEEIAKKYGVSINSVRKYCGDIIKPRSLQKPEVEHETEINSEVEKTVLSQHAGRILDYSRKRDADVIAAGEVVQKHLQEKGVNIDINQIPPGQLIKLIRSPLGDDMNPVIKSAFESWLDQQLSSPKTATSEKSGKLSFDDLKEVVMLKFLMKATSDEGNQGSGQWQQIISENEKLRQDLREAENKRKEDLDKLERKMQDLLFEKKLQTLEEKQADSTGNLSAQLEGLQQSIAQIKAVPNPTPDQKNSLEEAIKAVSDLDKLKGTLVRMGLVSAAPGTPAPTTMDVPDAFKNPDGTVNTIPYVIGRLADVAKPAIEAHFKKTPEQGEFVETPPPERRWTAAEYAEYLLGRPTLSPQEQQWLTNYRDYLPFSRV